MHQRPGIQQSVKSNGSEGGTFFVIGTPIGNLQDVSKRMVQCLESVDLVAAEDTRRTRHLLSSLGISKKLISCHEHNEASGAQKIVEALSRGEDVALVSDAGTPVLSDPGRRAVEAVREKGFKIVPVPGPSAVTAALSVSGLPADQFFFQGFLPSKKNARCKRLEELARIESTLVFFEAPHRLGATLKDMLSHLGDRETFMARELTKVHETLFRGRLSELLEEVGEKGVKGEITLVVAGAEASVQGLDAYDETLLKELLSGMVSGRRFSTKEAAGLVSSLTGISRNILYTAALECRDEASSMSK